MRNKSELDEYIKRCRLLTPEQRLKKMGEMRDFFFKHMTPEGRAFLLETRGIDTHSFEKEMHKKVQVKNTKKGIRKKG